MKRLNLRKEVPGEIGGVFIDNVKWGSINVYFHVLLKFTINFLPLFVIFIINDVSLQFIRLVSVDSQSIKSVPRSYR